MAYRALGQPAEQAEVWGRVAGRNRHGQTCTLTHRLALDAHARGLTAVVLRASHPAEMLARCLAGGLVVVANHRAAKDARGGHYSVVVAFDAVSVTVHDPAFGPDRLITAAEWSALWDESRTADVAGRVLVALGPADEAPAACGDCGEGLPGAVRCGWCQGEMPLRPAAAVGCTRARCPGRRWERIYCPHCDRPWVG
jgi:hypothetical protein